MPRIWIDSAVNNTIASGAVFLGSLMTGVSATQTRFDQMTLLRTIIGVDVAVLTHGSAKGSQTVSMGIAVASQEAFAAGTVSDSEVDTDFPTRGWVWRARYRIFGFLGDGSPHFTRRIDRDLRAMRKLENGEMFLQAANVALEGSTNAVTLTGLIRQLWLVG